MTVKEVLVPGLMTKWWVVPGGMIDWAWGPLEIGPSRGPEVMILIQCLHLR